MMKKDYETPSMTVAEFSTRNLVLCASDPYDVTGGFDSGGYKPNQLFF